MPFWRRHLVFIALMAVATPATIAFCWGRVIATINDDSVSYFALARMFGPGEPTAHFLTTFPPLFPLTLAAVGASGDLLKAHLLVAACAILALPLLYRFAALQLGGRAAPWIVAAFLLTPAAWIGAKGILSEPAFLLASLGCFVYFETRVERDASTRSRWIFGLLLAIALSLRTAGAALIVAYALHLAMRAVSTRRAPARADWIPFVLPAVSAGLWMALRPLEGGDLYARNIGILARQWLTTTDMLQSAVPGLVRGWFTTFAPGAQLSGVPAAALSFFGMLCLAGTLLRVRANRLDGWYVVVALGMVLALYINDDTGRRYLYPIVPLLLAHAATALAFLARRLPPMRAKALVALAVLAAAMVAVPSTVLVMQRALDGRVVLEGFDVRYSDMIDSYTAPDAVRARTAAKQAGVIAGFEAVAQATPPGARVMWSRPEYVAVLAHRPAEAWYYQWDDTALAKNIDARGVDYVVVTGLLKTDRSGRLGDQLRIEKALARYAQPALVIPNAVTGDDEFRLLKVDRAALAAFLAAAPR